MPEHPFRARHRLTHARDFQAVFSNRLAKARGPLTVFLLPNTHPTHRLGLSIGRRVGGAVVRVQLKRHIREAFRLDRPVYPNQTGGGHYDIVVSARAHKPLSLNDYRARLREGIEAAHRELVKRQSKTDLSHPPTQP